MGRNRSYSRSSSNQKKIKKKHKHHHKKHKSKHKAHKYQPEFQRQNSNDRRNIKYQYIKQQPQASSNQIPNQSQQQIQIQKPNFQPSGILLQYYNAREGVSLKFHEPPQAQKPNEQWRIYPFKQNQTQNPIILKQSCYLVGKDQRVSDILCENPSVSRQHAVIQFRAINKQNIDGSFSQTVKPYIMDLQSTNGTLLNGEKIEASRYYEVLDKDSIRFGFSTRDYVFFKVPALQEND